MSYELEFVESALKEWRKLSPPIREQFKKKLAERLERPRVPKSRLQSLSDCYKIKLRSSGYRLVYRVDDKTVVVTVMAVGRRDKSVVYQQGRQARKGLTRGAGLAVQPGLPSARVVRSIGA